MQANQCIPVPERVNACPVCDDLIPMDAIGKFCSFGSVFSGKTRIDSSSSTNATSCAKVDVHQTILGSKPEKVVRASLPPHCSCPQVKDSNSEVFVFAPKVKRHLVLDSEVYIVKKTESIKSDVSDLLSRCNGQ